MGMSVKSVTHPGGGFPRPVGPAVLYTAATGV